MKNTITSLAIAGLLGGAASDAFAQGRERRHAALDCFSPRDQRGEIEWSPGEHGVRNNGTVFNWAMRDLYCPVNSDDALPHDQVRTVRVVGTDRDPGSVVSAQVCNSFRWAVGGLCGAYRSTGEGSSPPESWDGGLFELVLTRGLGHLHPWSGWSVARFDFPYLHVRVPGPGHNDFARVSAIKGFILQDTE